MTGAAPERVGMETSRGLAASPRLRRPRRGTAIEERGGTAASPSESVIALYERHARAWAADRGRRLGPEKRWLDRFARLLPRGAAVLDIGCGSAEPIAAHLIRQGFDVSGMDASPTMVSLCRDRFPGREWAVADMRTLALGKRYRGLVAWDSFFHLAHDDQRRMFAVFRAHAAPGAALLFTSGPSHGEAIGAYRGESLHHASLSAAEYRSLLRSNGFGVVAHATDAPDRGGHTVWLARLRR
jgi:SAM-dependent methyltransferase